MTTRAATDGRRHSENGVGDGASSRSDRLAMALVIAGAIVYGVVFSLRTVAAYTSVSTLFDLATYEQGFWNALGWPPFFYSLEGEMSRFGRHFSPIFYLILPFYWLYSEPPTLLVVHSFALGLGAIPTFLLGRRYLGRWSGVLLALAYLASPAVEDINVQNEFHEIAFALPLLLLTFYLGLSGKRGWFVVALFLALSTREEVAVTTALFGVYLVVAPPGRSSAPLPNLRDGVRVWVRAIFTRAGSQAAWPGRACVAISVAWLASVVFVAMPYLNAGAKFPVPEGYEHLGSTPVEILRGIVSHPGVVARDVLSAPKLTYVFWLLSPMAFLSVLAPEVLVVGAPALAEILLITVPATLLHLRAVHVSDSAGRRAGGHDRRAEAREPRRLAEDATLPAGAASPRLHDWVAGRIAEVPD